MGRKRELPTGDSSQQDPTCPVTPKSVGCARGDGEVLPPDDALPPSPEGVAFVLGLVESLTELDKAAIKMNSPTAAKIASTIRIGIHNSEDLDREGAEPDGARAGLVDAADVDSAQNEEYARSMDTTSSDSLVRF